jgi:DNA helicase-2/ATP-dependent DNA helicase PcrA
MRDIHSDFAHFLQQNLNDSQRKAVLQDSGSLLVVAGAGSGKTRVITARMAHLIMNKNVLPSEIVALTFTNKAAKEMQERMVHFLGGKSDLPFIGTFHAYCIYLLKRNPAYLDIPFFSILDEDDQKKIITGILARNNLTKKTSPQNISYRISGIKNKLVNPSDAYAQYAHDPLFAQIYQAYEQERIASRCFDFDDLLLEGLKLFKNPGFQTAFQQTVRHVLIDEYQDTNVVQHELLKRMAKDSDKEFALDSICVVGDEDQSIYSWRGATVANIVNFKKDFPQTTLITIEQNYRSVQPILHVANEVINNNTIRNPKKLWSDRSATNRVYKINCLSEYHEGDMIAQFLSVATTQDPLQTTAILYRTHFQSRAIEEALIKQSLPYKIIGGIQFYERKEIKDLLAYLRLVVNPFDRPSFFRVINCPLRGLGEKFEELFYEYWHQEPFLTFIELAQKFIDNELISRTKLTGLIEFVGIFQSININDQPSGILDQVIHKTNYLSYLKKTYEQQELQERTENIRELVNAIKFFESQGTNTLSAFLSEVALMSDMQKKQDTDHNPIFMMTMHAAKGLEFDTVIIPGLDEGIAPSARSIMEVEKLEEERRLFYVGMTRARERLLLSRCRYRYSYGQMTDQRESRFLDELPKQYVLAHDLSHARSADGRLFFAQLFGDKKSAPTYTVPDYSATPVRTFGKTSASTLTIDDDPFPNKVPKKLNKPYSKPAPPNVVQSSPWKKNQPVKHATFGVGVVQSAEEKNDTSFIVTVQFKEGVKKISSQFLQKV